MLCAFVYYVSRDCCCCSLPDERAQAMRTQRASSVRPRLHGAARSHPTGAESRQKRTPNRRYVLQHEAQVRRASTNQHTFVRGRQFPRWQRGIILLNSVADNKKNADIRRR